MNVVLFDVALTAYILAAAAAIGSFGGRPDQFARFTLPVGARPRWRFSHQVFHHGGRTGVA
ncbi:MAG: hypothetical protein ACREI6_08335, partial [Candidatus Rokuibacteriota bacterium]